MSSILKSVEGLYLMAHLIITLVIIVAYTTLKAVGIEDDSFSNLLFILGGYWFGAMGTSKVKDKATTKVGE